MVCLLILIVACCCSELVSHLLSVSSLSPTRQLDQTDAALGLSFLGESRQFSLESLALHRVEHRVPDFLHACQDTVFRCVAIQGQKTAVGVSDRFGCPLVSTVSQMNFQVPSFGHSMSFSTGYMVLTLPYLS
jgi:hypothetical protein